MSMENNEIGRGSLMTPRLIVGLAIALFGVVLVLDRLNLVVADQVLQWWPAVIVAIGAVIFAQSRRVGGGINGIIVMIIGGWLLLNSLGILRVRFWELFWPLVLIAIGSVLVVQAMRRRTREASGADADGTLAIFAVLSGVKRISTVRAFPRRRGHSVHGRRAHRSATGHDSSRRGGRARYLCRDGRLRNHRAGVLDGGHADRAGDGWHRRQAAPASARSGVESIGGRPAPRLVLRGLLMMGGVEIKS